MANSESLDNVVLELRRGVIVLAVLSQLNARAIWILPAETAFRSRAGS